MIAQLSDSAGSTGLSAEIQARLQLLSPVQQQQVLDFVEFLVQKTQSDRPIWEEVLELAAQIPEEVWEQVPIDGAVQHDHYLYSVPKR
jgi:hypothetical protein